LSRQTDHSDYPDTLPREELNPTLNPILGQNMGRWAEVYYKSPPEKREEAVLELLHKLKAENRPNKEADAMPSRRVEAPIPQTDLIHCSSCGAENTADQRFCGMCGGPLETRPAEMPRTLISRTIQEPIHEGGDEVRPVSSVQNWQSSFLPREDDSYSNNHFLSGSYEDYEPPSRPYRAYVGSALAIIMVALGYMAWRSEQASSGSRLSPQAPPTVATEPVTPPAPKEQTSAPETRAEAAPAKNASTSDSSNSSAPPPEPAAKDTSAEHETERATPAAMIAKDQPRTGQPRNDERIQKRPQEPTTGGSGSEELAMARRYLSGTGGQPRNTAEAVDWLWKAVAKRNLDATLQLSDLFLRGNGVPKNCDQARVLLQAAATKGNSGAAERLRHMPVFGCD